MGAIAFPVAASEAWDTRHLVALSDACQRIDPRSPAWDFAAARDVMTDGDGRKWLVPGMGSPEITRALFDAARAIPGDDWPAEAIYLDAIPEDWVRVEFAGENLG